MMNPTDMIKRLRAANPAPTTPVRDDELLTAIVGTRGDGRLARIARPQRPGGPAALRSWRWR
jgi:hypothetical protein